MKKNMLMISYYAPPILNAESILVAKTLKFLSQMYEIDLLTVGPEMDFKQDPFLLEEMGKKVRVMRVENRKPTSRLMRKLYREAMGRLFAIDNPFWIAKAKKAMDGLQKSYDLIYSRSMPGASHVVALYAKEKLRVPWVAQFSDPWGNNPYHPLHGRKKQVIERFERRVIEQGDGFVFPTVEIRDLYASVYGRSVQEKALVVPHHFDEAIYETTGQAAGREKVRLAYIGDFYGLRSPEPLVKALHKLKERRADLVEQLELQVVGNVEGKFHGLLEEAQRSLGLNVQRVGQVPYRKSLELMRETDLLLLVDAPSDVNLFLSSKLIDYLGAQRPILGITSTKGTAGRLLTEYGWDVHHPNDVDEIAHSLERYLGELETYSQRALEAPVDRFRSEQVVEEMGAFFERVSGRKR
jgi:hypothetical protein